MTGYSAPIPYNAPIPYTGEIAGGVDLLVRGDLPDLDAWAQIDLPAAVVAGQVWADLPAFDGDAWIYIDAAPIVIDRIHTPTDTHELVPLVAGEEHAKAIPITRTSYVMDPLSADHPLHVTGGSCPAGDNTIVEAVVGYPHLWIGGKDVTKFRDAPTLIGRWESETPAGDTVAAWDMPQLNVWDVDGEDDLAFLYPDAPVTVGIVTEVSPGVKKVNRVWRGFYDAVRSGINGESRDFAYQAKGTLWQAQHQYLEPRQFTQPMDIWVLIARALNSVIARRWSLIPERPIGITTLTRGHRDQTVLERVQELLAEAVTDDGRQWTIHEPAPGVIRPLLKPALTSADVTVAVGTPGVHVALDRDQSTRVDAVLMRGIGRNNGGWANIFYPGVKLLRPPAYPNRDFRSINLGDTDADTDSGNGVRLWQRRMNETKKFDRLKEDGVFGAKSRAVLLDAQRTWGILDDGSLGPQSWNRSFRRVGPGVDLTPRRLPVAVKPWVLPRLYDSSGIDIGPNPLHDPTRVARWIAIDAGPGKSLADGRRLGRKIIQVYGEPHPHGTIVWEADPNETDRTKVRNATNVQVLGDRGENPMVQVAATSVELQAGSDDRPALYVVTSRVDAGGRDAMAVEDLLAQRRNAQPDPARRPSNPNRSSRAVNDQRIPWDSESECGNLPRTAINGRRGLPSIIPVPFAEVGKLAGIELHATRPFSFGIFASIRITENKLLAAVGNPFGRSGPWRTAWDQLEPYGIIEAWGEQGNRCGFSPHEEGEDDAVFSGRFILNTPVDYWTEADNLAGIGIFLDGSGEIWGDFIPAYEGN